MADPDHEPAAEGSGDHPAPVPPPHPSFLSLNTILETAYSAVAAQARDHADKALEHLLAQYFPLDPHTGRMTPRSVQVALPGPNGTPILRDVPLFTLASHHEVEIEAFIIKMKAALVAHPGANGVPQPLLDLSAAEGAAAALAEIEIRFRGADAPHGIARINDAIVKQIGPEER